MQGATQEHVYKVVYQAYILTSNHIDLKMKT